MDAPGGSCVNCAQPFERCKKGYKRKSLKSLGLTPKGKEGSFVCQKCLPAIKAGIKRTKTPNKRGVKRVLSTPAKVNTPKVRKTESYTRGAKSQAASALTQSKYPKACRIMMSSHAGKRGLMTAVTNKVRKEVSHYPSRSGSFGQHVSSKSLLDLDWTSMVNDAKTHMPVLFEVLKASMPNPSTKRCSFFPVGKSTKRPLSVSASNEQNNRRLALIFGIILYSNRPRVLAFVQGVMSLLLWRHGCSNKLITCMQKMGLSKGLHGARAEVDRISRESKDKIYKWRNKIIEVKGLDQPQRAAGRRLDFGLCGAPLGCNRQDHGDADDDSDDDEIGAADIESPDEESDQAGQENQQNEDQYVLAWDNVQIETVARHQSRDAKNKFRIWALTFGCHNRVPFVGPLTGQSEQAQNISLQEILPSPNDWLLLRKRMTTILAGILCKHFPFLDLSQTPLPKVHRFSAEMASKSEIVNLGVVEENPASTSGVIHIMEHLQNFVPSGNGGLWPIVCFGDGLSVERMGDAHKARMGAAMPIDRLEGLVECPQEFHKRGLLLQDTMDRMYKPSSVRERGTLFQLRQDFQHKAVRAKVMESFNHVWDLIEFTTESFSMLLALKILGLDNVGEAPSDFPTTGSTEQKRAWCLNVAERMMTVVWPGEPAEDIASVCSEQPNFAPNNVNFENFTIEPDEDGCKCGLNTGEPRIRCMNFYCSWYHFGCVPVGSQELDKEEWYCSQACEESSAYRYCYCHERNGTEETMYQCELQEACTQNEWYHPQCLPGGSDLPDVWYCCVECEVKASQNSKADAKLEYSRSLLYQGLFHVAVKEAIREGNGPEMMSHWRLNIIDFWNNNHPKYLIMAHRMLVGVKGFFPARIAHDVTWNRVANLQGQANKNIGLDLVNEFLNHEYKDMLKKSNGVYGKKQVERCSQLSGAFGKDLDTIVFKGKQASSHAANHRNSVADFIHEYYNEKLFDFVPGRAHHSFQSFRHTNEIKSPKKLGQKLLKLSRNLDTWASFV